MQDLLELLELLEVLAHKVPLVLQEQLVHKELLVFRVTQGLRVLLE